MDLFNSFVINLDIHTQCYILNKIRDIISIWNHRRPEIKECIIELIFDYIRLSPENVYLDSRILPINSDSNKSFECQIVRNVHILSQWKSALIIFRLPYSSLISFVPKHSNSNLLKLKGEKQAIQDIIWLYSLSTSELSGSYPNWADDNELIIVITDLINLASYSISEAFGSVRDLDETNQSISIISGLYSQKPEDSSDTSSCREYKFSLENLRKQLLIGKKIAFYSKENQLKIIAIPNVIGGFELIVSKRYYIEPDTIVYYELNMKKYHMLNNNESPMILELEGIFKHISDENEHYTALEFTIFDKYDDAVKLRDKLINKQKNTLGSRKNSFQLNMNNLEHSLKQVRLDSPQNSPKTRKGKEKRDRK